MSLVKVGDITLGHGAPPVLIAGPCVIESPELLLETGHRARDLAHQYGFPFILKSSFEKANRSTGDSYRGPGLEYGLETLALARQTLNVPVLTDIHWPEQAATAAQVVDCLQIPAFLCRQTELIEAAARTNLPVNVKKGQFMAPGGMKHAVAKAKAAGSGGVLLTERGVSFGYGDLVVDMRALVIMAELGVPVIFDATHSVQKPAGGNRTGGDRKFIEPLALAAAATGAIDGIFLEVHPDPLHAQSDAESQLPLNELERLLEKLRRVFEATGKVFP
jgi:2-dehydro-3-deoxyphosphooctonate aldolase (KDO 8-P synthase)